MSIKIEDIIDKLLIKGDGSLDSRLENVCSKISIIGTKSCYYIHGIQLDGNGNPRTKDLAEYITDRIVDYAIPRKERELLKEKLRLSGSTAPLVKLVTRARELFADLKKTGEGGEMLLYILTQEVLGYPQLLAKMPLKTSSKVHYHGVDGIHFNYNKTDETLDLYWGESKMYSKLSAGVTSCFKSINGFLLDTYGASSTQERDLQLITANINQSIDSQEVEDILVRYFDKDDHLSNKLIYKGICFIGFDESIYPNGPHSGVSFTEIKNKISILAPSWESNLSDGIKKHKNLEKVEIHIFLIPFPSVEEFRQYFLGLLD